jgi:NIMA (never in mitosis gene a)-related kinase
MEFAGSGDLMKKIAIHSKNGTYFSESEIWHIFIQIVAGLKALHRMRILHRDIKVCH